MFAAGMMMGGRPIFNIVLSASRSQWKLSSNGPSIPSIPVIVNLTINPGIEVQSSSASVPAIEIDGLAAGSEVNVTNLGYILGRGGNGGAGASGAGGTAQDGVNGQVGGDALRANFTGKLNLTNGSGHIWGGGGGGGGGDLQAVFNLPNFALFYGGGGGGGAGGSSGGAGGTGTFGTTGNSPGSAGTAGTGASVGVPGTGGAGAAGAGDGGNGGAYGAAGAAGQDVAGTIATEGTGGAAGFAVRQNAGTVVTFLSGSANPNIKGTVGT